MPWTRTDPMNERAQFIDEWRRGLFTMTELAAQYGVSRKTAYKWLARYRGEGIRGLDDRSRRPGSCPHRMAREVEELLLATRRAHPSWGPRKILPYLRRRHPDLRLPAASTIGDLFAREGLIEPKRRRRKRSHPGEPNRDPRAANELWTADFKGEFRLGNGDLCYPLTVADEYSRRILGCRGLPSTGGDGAIPAFRKIFREHGMPDAILTDNGVPFASWGLAGLTDMSVWWMRLGIEVRRTEPSSPQQNGVHERMHRTLKAEATKPPRHSMRSQQRRFDGFVREYNEDRPHEALDGEVPNDRYEPSRREFPDRLPEVEYPGHFERRKVSKRGAIRWRVKQLYVSLPLRRQTVGLEEVADGVWSVYFGPTFLGRLDERDGRVYS